MVVAEPDARVRVAPVSDLVPRTPDHAPMRVSLRLGLEMRGLEKSGIYIRL
jgi:hypothetical protein